MRFQLISSLSFLVLTHALYYPAWNAGFVTDFNGLMLRMEDASLSGIFTCFGFPALEQALNAVLYAFYKLFGLNPLPWYLAFTFMHALNGGLLYRFVYQLLKGFNVKDALLIALVGSLFFLLSPYQSEVLTWKVCFNFLMVTALTLSSLRALLSWLEKGGNAFFWKAHLFFLLALFTFELALMLPFMSSLLILFYPYKKKNSWQLVLPQFSLLSIYFLLNKLILGVWVGHYGADVHLRFSASEMLSNFLSYIVKLLGFTRYYKHSYKQAIFEYLNQNSSLYIIAGSLILVIVFALLKYPRLSPKNKVIIALFSFFCFAIGPVLNLYFNYLLHIENDRYSYLASAFFFPILVLMFSLLPRIIFINLCALYLLISVYFLHATNQYWKHSTRMYYGLIESFDPGEASAVFLLNLPENYKGAPMFGDYSDKHLAFRSSLHHIGRKKYDGQLFDVAQYNMTRPTGGVTVTSIDSTHQLKIEFRQWGNWWWHKGIGMGSGYENDVYQIKNHGHHYIFTPKDIPDKSLFLMQDGAQWVKVESHLIE